MNENLYSESLKIIIDNQQQVFGWIIGSIALCFSLVALITYWHNKLHLKNIEKSLTDKLRKELLLEKNKLNKEKDMYLKDIDRSIRLNFQIGLGMAENTKEEPFEMMYTLFMANYTFLKSDQWLGLLRLFINSLKNIIRNCNRIKENEKEFYELIIQYLKELPNYNEIMKEIDELNIEIQKKI